MLCLLSLGYSYQCWVLCPRFLGLTAHECAAIYLPYKAKMKIICIDKHTDETPGKYFRVL